MAMIRVTFLAAILAVVFVSGCLAATGKSGFGVKYGEKSPDLKFDDYNIAAKYMAKLKATANYDMCAERCWNKHIYKNNPDAGKWFSFFKGGAPPRADGATHVSPSEITAEQHAHFSACQYKCFKVNLGGYGERVEFQPAVLTRDELRSRHESGELRGQSVYESRLAPWGLPPRDGQYWPLKQKIYDRNCRQESILNMLARAAGQPEKRDKKCEFGLICCSQDDKKPGSWWLSSKESLEKGDACIDKKFHAVPLKRCMGTSEDNTVMWDDLVRATFLARDRSV